MDHWPFITAAYALTIAGVLGTSLWAWRAARAAERDAGDGTERD